MAHTFGMKKLARNSDTLRVEYRYAAVFVEHETEVLPTQTESRTVEDQGGY